jgi:hypothetical protein
LNREFQKSTDQSHFLSLMSNPFAVLAEKENEAPKETTIVIGRGSKYSQKARKVHTRVLEFDFGYLSRGQRHANDQSKNPFIWRSEPQPQPQSQPQSQAVRLTAEMFPPLK